MLGFSIGLRALQTSQRAIDVLGQNITNFATEGYSRKTVGLSSTDPVAWRGLPLGTGVEISQIQRIQDRLIESRLRDENQAFGQARESAFFLRAWEGLVGEPGDGVSSQLGDLFAEVSALTIDPADGARRSSVIDTAESLATQFRELSHRADELRHDSRRSVTDTVEHVNSLTKQIADLNQALLTSSGTSSPPPDMLDQLGQHVFELSELVGVQAVSRERGTVDVLVDGLLLVSGERPRELSVTSGANGQPQIQIEGHSSPVNVQGGKLAGALHAGQGVLPEHQAALDEIARALILETNRLHSTGVGVNGSFQTLAAGFAAGPAELSRPLSELDLPFAPTAGDLLVNVVDEQTGAVEQTVVSIDPAQTTLSDFANALDRIAQLSAGIDGEGRLRITSSPGYGFDFASRIDPNPDEDGTFGGAAATLIGARAPFALNNGDQFQVVVDGGAAQLVTLASGQFANINQATAQEVAAAINAQVSGVTAKDVDGVLALAANSNGGASSIQLTDVAGTPAAALGLSTALETGSDQAVAVTLEGVSEDPNLNGRLTVRANADGTIGLTPGLRLDVYDQNDQWIGTLDVGDNYSPGDRVEVIPGVTATISAGDVSATAGDQFSFLVMDDPDSSDVLVGLEIGTFFQGTGASDIQVATAVQDDAGLLATSRTGSGADSSNLLRWLRFQDEAAEGLSGSVTDGIGEWVATVGRDVQAANTEEEVTELKLQSLQARREEISGVNLDEELLRLTEMEQLYQAAGRYLQAVSQMNAELFNLV